MRDQKKAAVQPALLVGRLTGAKGNTGVFVMDGFYYDTTSSHLDDWLGADEQRTKPYTQYGEGAAESGTTPSAKNTNSVASSASQQSGAVEGVVEHRGFPNPATDTNIVPLDLTKLLIKHPLSTFFMRIDSNGWEHFGIFKEDLAIIDRSLKPKPIDLVIWWDETAFVLSRFHKLPLNTTIWGVITSIVHRYTN